MLGRAGNPALHFALVSTFIALPLAMLFPVANLYASEFGVSTYRPGIMDLSSGMLPPPGHLVFKDLFLFFDASAKAVSEDRMIEAHANTALGRGLDLFVPPGELQRGLGIYRRI